MDLTKYRVVSPSSGVAQVARARAADPAMRVTVCCMSDVRVYVTPEEKAALIQAKYDVEAMALAVHDELGRIINAPAPGSVIARCDLVKDPDGWWLMCGQYSLFSATDHLHALMASWARLDGIPNASGYTLIRGAAEGAARACWFFEPSITDRQRIARGIIDWQNMDRRQRGLRGDIRELQERRAAMVATVTSADFDPANLGEKRPDITPLMRSLLPTAVEPGGVTMGGLLYSLLSGYAHAEPWMMLADRMPVGSGLAVIHVNVKLQILLLRRAALHLLHLAMCLLLGLAGFDDEAWRARFAPIVLRR